MNQQQRRAFKVRVSNQDTLNPVLFRLAQQKALHAEAVLEATRWHYREVLTPVQKAGPFRGCYTAQLLGEAESGMTTVQAIKAMKEAEEYGVRVGAWPQHSPYYASICEAISILRPQA